MQTIQDNFSYNAGTSILFTTHVTSRHVSPSYYYYYIFMTTFEGKFVKYDTYFSNSEAQYITYGNKSILAAVIMLANQKFDHGECITPLVISATSAMAWRNKLSTHPEFILREKIRAV